jgi:hypothetical protein
MPKKKPVKKRRGRRNAFDAALDKAVKRWGICLEERKKHLAALDELAVEIPDLERKISALGGNVPASPEMPAIPGLPQQVPQAIAAELHAAPTYASAGLLNRKAPVKEMTPAEATAAARRAVDADNLVRARRITSIPANNGTPTGDANILDGTGVAGDDSLPDVEGKVIAEGGQ